MTPQTYLILLMVMSWIHGARSKSEGGSGEMLMSSTDSEEGSGDVSWMDSEVGSEKETMWSIGRTDNTGRKWKGGRKGNKEVTMRRPNKKGKTGKGQRKGGKRNFLQA
ncbi:uncharacterized protein LOC128245428 [Mya arenaria]|uniref:uncharacterized protein LOC128245428 n=1 Tax=Mya arenaria TaxID=6604 RepID=UPI0022E17829|nr:uncharacterized protein LOC128245428 [Mya arenaria]XP_052819525.1 uncharacterized protein LOC128245428 [Mya arenaria]